MLKKIIVCVGPELTVEQSRTHSLDKDSLPAALSVSYCEFPEQGLGPRMVRSFVRQKVKTLVEREDEWGMFLSSRYGYALNELAQMVADKELDPNLVQIILYTEDGRSDHKIDVFGFMSSKWPYGILS